MINIKRKNELPQPIRVLDEIKYLRKMQDYLIDTRNSNRYRVMVKERQGHTVYCFSTPIYNVNTQKLVCTNGNAKSTCSFIGTNGVMSINQNRCVFETREGRIFVILKDPPTVIDSKDCCQNNIAMSHTLNGIRFTVNGNRLDLQLKSEIKQEYIRFHSTCFSVMVETFKPFLSVAGLYARNEKGEFSPLEMEYRDRGNQTYDISLFHALKDGSFTFEINLYEPKLFQDTTVESLHPDVNNVFGAIGFVGKTKEFGEQWLYSRPDFTKISDLAPHRIDGALLHVPVLNGSTDEIDVFVPRERFCSFGSTWKEKINESYKIATSKSNGRYLTIDVTSVFTNPADRTLVYNEGLIFRKAKGKNNYIAISTGDCYSTPQILEIKFKIN